MTENISAGKAYDPQKKVLYMHVYVYSIIYKCFSKWVTCFGLFLSRSFYINANYLFLVVIFVFQASLFSFCFLALNTQQIPLHLYFIQSLFHLCPQSPCSIEEIAFNYTYITALKHQSHFLVVNNSPYILTSINIKSA